MKTLFFAIFSLILTACSSKPVSYLPSPTAPIVNIEAEIAEKINVQTTPTRIQLENRTEQPLHPHYQLFWYDKNGVTQSWEEQAWQRVVLLPKQRVELPLQKPTETSESYRFYLRAN